MAFKDKEAGKAYLRQYYLKHKTESVPTVRQRVCLHCGKHFEQIGKGRNAEYCDKVCYNKSDARRIALHKNNTTTRYAKVIALQEKVNSYKAVPCVDCKVMFDPIAMDFEHTEDNKVMNVSRMVAGLMPWEQILAEILKCEVVCSNCHRVRTRDRQQATK